MPFNTKLFPTDYTAETVPGVEIDAPSPIESDVEKLQLEAKRNVILAANQARRVAAATISNQNQLTAFVYPSLLPKEWVGRRKYPVPGVLGVKGITAGGTYLPYYWYYYNSCYRFLYSNEVAGWIGAYLIQPRSYTTGLSSLTDGYVCGGYQHAYWWARAWSYIDKINFTTEGSKYIGELSYPYWYWHTHRYAMCGAGNQTAGYLFGGANHISYYFNTAEKLTYDTDARSNLGITFAKTFSYGTTTTTKDNAYILNAYTMGPGYSGNSSYWQHWSYRSEFNPLNDIYKFNYNTETATSLGKNTINMTHGGAAFEYVAGDRAYAAHGWTPGSGHGAYAIERWDFSTETMATTGVNCSARHGNSSMQSSSVGYFCGGYTPSNVVQTQYTCDRFVPNGEVNVRLGVSLGMYLYYTATLKDYHGGIA